MVPATRAPADDPANASQLWQLGQRFLELEKQLVFVWEVWDLGEVAFDGTVVREPSYGIFEAEVGRGGGTIAETAPLLCQGLEGGRAGGREPRLSWKTRLAGRGWCGAV